MPIDASLYSAFAPRVQSPTDVQNGLMQGAMAQNQLAQGRMQMQQAQNVMQQRAALSNALQSGQLDLTNPAHAAQAMALAPDIAPAIVKTVQEGQEKASKRQLEQSQIPGHEADATNKALTAYRSVLTPDMTPDQFTQWAGALYKDPRTAGVISAKLGPPEGVQAKIAAAASDPQKWKDYLAANAVGMEKFIQDQTTQRGQNMTAATAAAEQGVQKRGQDVSASTARAVANIHEGGANTRNAATLAKDFKIAGIDPQTGNFVGGGDGQGGNLVDMVGQNKVPLATALARMPIGQKEAFAAQVQQKYPGFDPAVLPRRIATEKDFAPGGKSGQQITNANTALHHAGQVADAIEKLNNSDVLPGLVNPVTNLVAQKAFNDTSQGVYKQKVDAMASELRKLYAGASGGGLEELKSWQSNFDPNASKKQQQAYLQGGMELLTGAIQAKRDAFERGMDGTADFGKLLSPESKKVLQRLAPEYAATLGGGAPQPGRTVTRTGTDASGKKVIQYSDGTIEHAN